MVSLALAAAALAGGCDGEDDSAETAALEPGAVASVGEPPTHPPAPTRGLAARPPEPTVIASGAATDDEPFELVIHGTERGTCITLVFPVREREGGAVCGKDVFGTLDGAILATGQAATGHGKLAYGLVGPEVETVELSYEHDGEQQTFDAVSEQVASKLLRQSGEREPRGIFIAFLPPGVHASEVTASALDGEGQSIGTARWPDLSSIEGPPDLETPGLLGQRKRH